MYIHKKYLMKNECTGVKEYKSALKEICKLNLRRSSKFNILAILGALRCQDNNSLTGNTGIYVGSEYSSMNSVKKVLEEVSNEAVIMPFDFLNINSNNVSFYVSQALSSIGKNMLLTSDELSYERALEVALFDLEIDEVDDAFIGLVDESLNNIKEYNKYILNTIHAVSYDYSGWLYMNKTKKDSLCKIEIVNSFSSVFELNHHIDNLNSDVVYLNNISKENLEYLSVDTRNVLINERLNTLESIISFIDSVDERMICISMDSKSKGYIFFMSK
jgi:hypothetical protein